MGLVDGFIRTFFDKFRFYGGYMFAPERTWEEAVDAGDVAGASLLRFYGRNAAVADGEALWAVSTAYTWQTANQQPIVVSSSANDDGAPAGSGAQIVRIWWLDSAYTETYEDVTLNGVGNVNMVANTVRRINRVEVIACGTTGWNEGNITVYAADGVTVMAYMPIGQNVNDGIIQSVPTGKADYIKRITLSATDTLRVLLWVRALPADPWVSYLTLSEETVGNPYWLDVPIKIAAGCDYFFACATSGAPIASAEVYGWRMNA